MSFEEFWQPLLAVYDKGEAKAIARTVMEMAFGLTMTDIVCGRVQTLDEQALLHVRQRLMKGEPVQYVLGEASFGDRLFTVSPAVLIPRPETFELCQWIITNSECGMRNSEFGIHNSEFGIKRILDIGTGSGCIACTLAAELPQVQVTAWDISPDALTIAAENTKRHHVDVTFEQVDILDPSWRGKATGRRVSGNFAIPDSQVGGDLQSPPWDIIVSNPPYICQNERAGMEANVLNHEPDLALFVPDDDPLLFYRSIANYALHSLAPDGQLFFEINPLYAEQLKEQLTSMGFIHTEIRNDQFGRKRFMVCYTSRKNSAQPLPSLQREGRGCAALRKKGTNLILPTNEQGNDWPAGLPEAHRPLRP